MHLRSYVIFLLQGENRDSLQQHIEIISWMVLARNEHCQQMNCITVIRRPVKRQSLWSRKAQTERQVKY